MLLDIIVGSHPPLTDPVYSPIWGWSRQPLASRDLGCYLLAHLAMVPDSRFSKGQARLLSQGHIGLASEGPSGWFARIWGDFEPSAVAGVVSPTSRVHGLPGWWPASCWGAGFAALATCRGQQSQKREDGEQRSRRSLSPAWHASDSQMDAVAAGQQGQGLLGDLGLGLQVGISTSTWDTVNIRQHDEDPAPHLGDWWDNGMLLCNEPS